MLEIEKSGGEGGIRTLGTGVSPYNGLANRRIRPLCHLSGVRTYSLPRLGQALFRALVRCIFIATALGEPRSLVPWSDSRTSAGMSFLLN